MQAAILQPLQGSAGSSACRSRKQALLAPQPLQPLQGYFCSLCRLFLQSSVGSFCSLCRALSAAFAAFAELCWLFLQPLQGSAGSSASAGSRIGWPTRSSMQSTNPRNRLIRW